MASADFDLDNFLNSYRPKSLVRFLKPYLNHRKLLGYQLLESHNKTIENLTVKQTYIKYIKITDAEEGKFKSEHIKAGGILIACGKMINNMFVTSDDPRDWDILKLKFDPSPIFDKKGNVIQERIDPRIYHIKISKYYVFFKKFELTGFAKQLNKVYDVELIKSKNNTTKIHNRGTH